ncbi:MAG: cupin domain-containing protein [Myxococcota bacterium]
MSLDDTSPDVRADLFGGTGTVKVWNMMTGRAAPFTAALWCELEAGGSVGRHRQEHFPEIVIGVEGHGEATIGDAAHPLNAGDMVHLPLGSILSLRNLSADAPLRYLIIKAK